MKHVRAPHDSTAAAAGSRRAPRGAPGAGARSTGMPAVALAVALVGALAGCAPPSDRAAGAPPVLYVATGRDGALSQLDSATGRPLGPPLAAGTAPGQVARGRDGSLLVLSAARDAAQPLTRLAPTGDGYGWAARPVAWPGPTYEARLAGDGGRYAVVADRAPAGGLAAAAPPWRLTLVDVPAGAVVATSAVGGPHELVTGLALDDGPGGPVAYLALWRTRAMGASIPGASPGPVGHAARVVAVDARTGATVAVLPLAGVVVPLALGPAPGGLGRRLYAVERLAGPEDEAAGPTRGRLLGLHPTTLEVESARPLDGGPSASPWPPTARPPMRCTTAR